MCAPPYGIWTMLHIAEEARIAHVVKFVIKCQWYYRAYLAGSAYWHFLYRYKSLWQKGVLWHKFSYLAV